MNIRYLASAGLTILVAGIVVVIIAVSGRTAKSSAAQTTGGTAIGIRSTSLGQTLVDGHGRTLYLFEGDKTNLSTLSAAGFAVWPAFTATGPVKAENGAQAGKIATIAGPNATRQVTYNGHPLYYYVGDTQPGDTKGQGINEFGPLWYVLGVSGNAITHAPRSISPQPAAPASTSTGSYGY